MDALMEASSKAQLEAAGLDYIFDSDFNNPSRRLFRSERLVHFLELGSGLISRSFETAAGLHLLGVCLLFGQITHYLCPQEGHSSAVLRLGSEEQSLLNDVGRRLCLSVALCDFGCVLSGAA